MKIVLDTSTIQQEMSGTGYYTLGMLRELLKMDSIDVVQTLGGSKKILQNTDNGKIVHHFPDENRWHRLLNVTMAANRPNINADIALFPNYFMPPGFPIPSLVTVHDLSFISHPQFYSWKMRTFYRHRIKHTFTNADRILTVSQESKHHIQKYSGLPSEKILSISPGPSLPKNGASCLPNTPAKYFLWNGNIEARKNVVPTIHAFLEAQLDDYHLVLAGKRFCGNRYWEEFKQLADLSEKVHYLGYIENQELKQWYTRASGVVYCSHIEGFGIPIVNARSMHKPSLISSDPALQEAAGHQAVVVNARDISDIRRGFTELADKLSLNQNHIAKPYALEFDLNWKRFELQLEEVICRTTLESKRSAIIPFSKPGISELKKSILKTLAYSSVFHAPVQLEECFRELHFTSCTFVQFKKAVQELNNRYPDLLIREEEYLGLSPYVESIKKHRELFSDNNKFIEKHQSLIRMIGKIPWISGIYFSGGTVHASHLDKPDLDLFIVAASNRVWLAYSLLKLLAVFTRSKELLCFNYLIDRENMHVQSQQDLYTAHQILHLKPAISGLQPPDVKAANPWVFDYFPNSRPKNVENPPTQKPSNSNPFSVVMELINLLLMAIWTWFWNHKEVKNRTGGIRWEAHQIKLHTNDHRPFVYKKYQALLNDVMLRVQTHNGHSYLHPNSELKSNPESELIKKTSSL